MYIQFYSILIYIQESSVVIISMEKCNILKTKKYHCYPNPTYIQNLQETPLKIILEQSVKILHGAGLSY